MGRQINLDVYLGKFKVYYTKKNKITVQLILIYATNKFLNCNNGYMIRKGFLV